MFLLWSLQTLLALWAGYSVALVFTRAHGSLVRLLSALVLTVASTFSILQALGLAGILGFWTLLFSATSIHALASLLAFRHLGASAFLSIVRSDAAMPGRLIREVRDRHELAAWAFVGGGAALIGSLFIAWHFPNWSWDCAWYHAPMTNYPVQSGSLGWVDTHIPYINSYPRLVELLGAWNVLLHGNSRLDDLPQILFGVLGALAVAALCRRSGAGPALSASLGAMWLALPAVFLQLHTTHADVAAGALFIAAFFFLTARPFDGLARWMTLVCFGLYAACKVTGLFHLILLAPLVAWRFGAELWRQRDRRGTLIAELGIVLLVFIWLASVTYVQNVFHTGNPFWPARLTVPLLGWKLPGEMDVNQIAGPPAFFGAPGAFTRMVKNWFNPSDNYFPDVREGPFGVLFPYVLLPALLLVTVIAPFRRNRWHLLSLALLGAVATLVPAAWWGRFILALPAASLAAFAALHTWLGRRWLQLPLTALAAALSIFGYVHAVSGYRVLPSLAIGAEARQADQVRLRREIDWLFPPDALALREETLQAGDVVTYDSGASFLGELWTYDLRNQVHYVPHRGDDEAWLKALGERGATWVGVGRNSPGERLLKKRPEDFEPLFAAPRSGEVFYRARSAQR